MTSFDVPAQMPPCSGKKCIVRRPLSLDDVADTCVQCAWFWLANKGKLAALSRTSAEVWHIGQSNFCNLDVSLQEFP